MKGPVLRSSDILSILICQRGLCTWRPTSGGCLKSFPSLFLRTTSRPSMNKKLSLDDTCSVFLSRHRFKPTLTTANAIIPPPSSSDVTEKMWTNPMSLSPLIHGNPLAFNPTLPPSQFVHPSSLPIPGAADLAPKSTRQSHARRQPAGHIPRPRNAFILFRCDFVQQRKIPQAVENDHRNLSRIAGKLWREMSKEDKQPWIELALKEKERHAALYPNYKYAPVHNTATRVTIAARQKKTKETVDPEVEEREMEAKRAELSSYMVEGDPPGRDLQRGGHRRRGPPQNAPYPILMPPRRSSSCPPVGSVPIPTCVPLESWTQALTTQDDLARRPSRTTMYHSVTSEPIAPISVRDFHALESPWVSAPTPFEWPLFQDVLGPLTGPLTLGMPQFTSPFGTIDQLPPLPISDDTFDSADRMARLSLDPDFTNPFDSRGLFYEANNPGLPLPISSTVSPLDLHVSASPALIAPTLLLSHEPPSSRENGPHPSQNP
ncbi:hypothetical protein BV22DRAFT_406588 [Leucogyrophana mollusca]|uniref:Uncharacterized protein n=1 Tax=Leucogyrophana mollusca TaxID=85980 RepID=A0ACB8BK91_9AGAM|nr:hypothetical protein BV22DRAFT_406588 [Leucogyrophana mollusca]